MAKLEGFAEGSDLPTLLNALRAENTITFQTKVPELTQDNIREYGASIMQDSALQNEWLHSLINRIGLTVIKYKSYQNPLRRFKKGKLELGETIQEIFVGLIEEKVGGGFPDEDNLGSLFKVSNPDVHTIFHKINRKAKFPVTIDQQKLRTAFTSHNNLNNLVSAIISQLYTSDEVSEYVTMKSLLKNYDDKGLFKKVTVPALTTPENVKKAVVEIRAMSNSLTFMRDDNNSLNVPTHTPKENQIIMVNPRFDAQMDVEVLAEAFNMSKAEFLAERILLDDFGGMENVVAILVDKDFFMVYDQLFELTSVFNQEYLYWNYFLHHHGVYSVSRFANAVVFTTDVLEEVTSVKLTSTLDTVAKGNTEKLTAVVAGGYSSAVTYAIKGSISQETNVSDKGFLYIGLDEKATEIEVLAISVQDPSKTSSKTFTIS